MDDIAIGFIRTSHGVRGHLKVVSYSGEYGHFMSLKQVSLRKGKREKTFSIEKVEKRGQLLLLKLEGIDSPEAGKEYANWEIWVPRKFGAKKSAGEYYISELCGCSILFEGSVIGKVNGVMDNGATDLLEIIREDGERTMVPFLKQFVGEVSLKDRTIELLEGWFLS